MKKYKILHLPTATYLYSFAESTDPEMLYSEIEAVRRFENNKIGDIVEEYTTLFEKKDAVEKIKYCVGRVVFSFDENCKLKTPLYKHHVELIEVKDEDSET
jgi:hypothetical protein